MSLYASLVVSAPRSDAIARVRHYFEERTCGVRLYRTARVEVLDLAVRTAFTPHAEHALAVRWEPTRGGLMPTLHGTLTARAHAVGAMLHFEGTYESGLGALVGRCIARIAIHALLRDIRRDLARPTHARGSSLADSLPHGSTPGLRGRAFVRRDGTYVACTIVLEGDVVGSPIVAGDRSLSVARVEALLRELETSDLRGLPERVP